MITTSDLMDSKERRFLHIGIEKEFLNKQIKILSNPQQKKSIHSNDMHKMGTQ